MSPDPNPALPRRLLRRLALAAGAVALLWIGLGQPHAARPLHRAEWLTADGLRTRAIRAGRGDTTLVFLHGYGESLVAWRPILDRFTRDHRVLAVDLPGFGLADKPDGRYDNATYDRWLSALLTRYTRGPLVVIGHSMGGQLAAAMALEHPDRVVAAVLIAPAGAGINPLLTDTGGIASPATQWVASAISFVLPVHDSAWLRDPDSLAAYDPATDPAAERTARRVLTQFDFAALEPRFGQLRQPVLLLWGRQDPTIPISIGERIAAVLHCRRYVPLFTLHRPHQTLPDTVAAEIARFLRHPGCGD